MGFIDGNQIRKGKSGKEGKNPLPFSILQIVRIFNLFIYLSELSGSSIKGLNIQRKEISIRKFRKVLKGSESSIYKGNLQKVQKKEKEIRIIRKGREKSELSEEKKKNQKGKEVIRILRKYRGLEIRSPNIQKTRKKEGKTKKKPFVIRKY